MAPSSKNSSVNRPPAYSGFAWVRQPGGRSPVVPMAVMHRCSGTKHVLADDALGARPAQADHVPVVDDLEVGAVDEQPHEPRRLAALHDRAAHEVGRVVTARGVVPGAADGVAAVRGHRHAGLHRPARNAQVAVAPYTSACASSLQWLRRCGWPAGQREHPAARRTASGDLAHHADEVAQAELVAAEAARLERAVEAGLDERFVRLVEQAARRLRRGLPFAEHGHELLRPRQHLGRRQVWLRRRDLGRSQSCDDRNHQDS